MKLTQLLKSLATKRKERKRRKEVKCKTLSVFFGSLVYKFRYFTSRVWFDIVYVKKEQDLEFIEGLFIVLYLLNNLAIILSL